MPGIRSQLVDRDAQVAKDPHERVVLGLRPLEVHRVVEAVRRIVERAAEGPAGTLDEHVGQRRCHRPRAVRRERDGHRGLAGYRGRGGHRFQR